MAKQTVLLFIIIPILMIFPSPGFGNKAIKTTQRIIVIDPGHGGAKKGIVTSGGIQEKTIALHLAKKTAEKLESRYTVLLTRERDTVLSARERIFFANKNRADLLVCIHLHHSDIPAVFFYYFEPPDIIDKHAGNDGRNTWKSQPLLHQSASKNVIRSFISIFSANQKKQKFFSKGIPAKCLEGATMPAILIEPFSISLLPQNPDEIENILDDYARLISKSIDLYFRKK